MVTVNGVGMIFRNLCFLFMCTCNHVTSFLMAIYWHMKCYVYKNLQILIEFKMDI